MKEMLREMSDRDFEVLSRFYLREHPPEQICAEMGLTQVQFQLLKSRAKARLADRMQRKLRAKRLVNNDNDGFVGRTATARTFQTGSRKS